MPMSTYTVSKYATLAFTDTARRAFADTGVNVSLLAPGWVLTERVAELTGQSPQAAAAILPLAQESCVVAEQGFDGLLRNEYIILTNPASGTFAIEHAQAIIGEVEHRPALSNS